MFVRDIQGMGLTEKEAKFYLTSLRLGPSSMQVLARKAKIDRGTAYHVAMTLEQKGLFGQLSQGKRPLFGVTNPRSLFTYVETRRHEVEQQFKTAESMIGDLEELYATGFSS
ncbi:hypothetical protein BH11PAT4_BH11PAT4_4640 [soil metagenome]